LTLRLFPLNFFSLFFSAKSDGESGSLIRTWSNLTSIGQITKELLDNNCRIIDLSHNLIEFDDNVNISDVLRNQNDLEIIRLNFNQRFDAGRRNHQIFDNKNLRIFECIQCGFYDIESEYFVAFTNLTELRLNENNIERIIESAFRANVNLSLLDLSKNNLELLPLNLFATTMRFESLILSRNPIKIPKSSALLKSNSIKLIQLDNCNLTTIYAETFSQLGGLESLNLTGNLISILPATSFNINLNLKSLFVEDNRITTFPVSLLQSSAERGLRELCVDKNNFEKGATLEFEKFVKMYVEHNLRGDNCQSDLSYFIEFRTFSSEATSLSLLFVKLSLLSCSHFIT
jgi:Leucine-rich repeat (LRR) protein